MTKPDMPPIKCVEPGCTGMLILHAKPSHWSGPSPWVYICENRGACSGVQPADKQGGPYGVFARHEVREARAKTAAKLARFWTGEGDKIDFAMRARTFHYIGHVLNLPHEGLDFIADLDDLRRVWELQRDMTAEQVSDWWEEEGRALYGKQKKEKTDA